MDSEDVMVYLGGEKRGSCRGGDGSVRVNRLGYLVDCLYISLTIDHLLPSDTETSRDMI
jgi:hypothetical protein